ncbi:MAG: metallophosphoesterase [Longimicrobiales bacterium]|nr:metallophosphoesterase [Longimicrobiales bacterium]
MITLVHASDVHFGVPHAAAAAGAFLRAAHALQPDAVIISGDLTQRAKVAEYRAAAAFLERLPDVPLVLTPGNHDVPLLRVAERLFAPFRNYRSFIRDDLDEVTQVKGCTVVSLNTAAPRTAIINGRLSRDQLAFAAEAFAAAPGGDLRVLVAHHPFAPPPDYEGARAIPGARRHLMAFVEMGVDLVLGGHLHRAYLANSLDVLPDPHAGHPIVIAQSGTTTSTRGRARERRRCSFNVVRADEHSIEVAHHHFDGEADAFRASSLHLFPRRPAAWLPGSAGARLLESVPRTEP